jgi:hypothetical protein
MRRRCHWRHWSFDRRRLRLRPEQCLGGLPCRLDLRAILSRVRVLAVVRQRNSPKREERLNNRGAAVIFLQSGRATARWRKMGYSSNALITELLNVHADLTCSSTSPRRRLVGRAASPSRSSGRRLPRRRSSVGSSSYSRPVDRSCPFILSGRSREEASVALNTLPLLPIPVQSASTLRPATTHT